ncbi:hypothetical protein N7540_008911 [Penicillium herquei]|nr:hypothetical protein N7540_008911 [Penicillium herquei]
MWSRNLGAVPSRRTFHVLTFAFAVCFALVGFLLLTRSRDHFIIALPSGKKAGSSHNQTDECGAHCDKGLPFLKTSHSELPIPYDPYPDYNSPEWRAKWTGNFQRCVGPDGSELDSQNVHAAMKGFKWNEFDSPPPMFGSYEAWKLDNRFCTNRYSRYGAYGYEDDTEKRNETTISGSTTWEGVNWGRLHQDCLQRNADRFESSALEEKTWILHKEFDFDEPANHTHTEEQPDIGTRGLAPEYHSRTAVIIRGWIGMDFSEDGIHNMRSMIMELSLFSGAEYEVILLVDCKGTALPPAGDKKALEEFKKEHLPEEFRDMVVFFNTEILEDWYPKIDDHGAMAEYFQPVQIFSRLHPQYEHIWQFEMDSRYTGHWYHFLQQASTFAKQQPRKNMWERNSYFYIPAIHGPWDDFIESVDRSMIDQDSILGPRPANGTSFESFKDETPMPPQAEDDIWSWGVGEDADIITWLPSFDPTHTGWPFRDHLSNFPAQENMPRRVSIVAMSRVSARLLRRMHVDKVNLGLGMHSEMSPLTWALFYGLKSVQVPQPIYHAQKWDPVDLNARANPGEPGSINAGGDSMWNPNPETAEVLLNITYMFATPFPERLYRAWLGYDEGEEFDPICLPPMLLHPVKNTKK